MKKNKNQRQEFDGLAHLLEHSMFLGSKNFPERCLEERWEGVELGEFFFSLKMFFCT